MKMNLLSLKECMLNKRVHVQTGPFGTQLKASEYTDSGIPVINVRNIGLGNIRPEKLEYISNYKANKLKAHFLKQGDIVFGRKGAVERHLFVKKEQEGWIQGSDCLRLRILTPEISAQFLSYYFQTQGHQDWMNNLCSFGATMTSLNQEIISRIEVPIPEIGIQLKIVDILSAYDDLIEVNNQRIKLLEETARELYKEWFLRMRFPGWKETKFVKGVPEGWEVKKLFDFADITYGFPFQSGLFNEIGHGLPVIRIRDILDSSTKTFTTEIANSKYYVTNGDILVGMDGDFHISKWSGGKAWLNQRVVRLRTKSIKDESLPFLFYAIKAPIEFLNSIIVGTTVAHLSDRDMKKILLLIPNASILKKFKEIADPLYELEVLLNEQNTQLRQIRDRLLPRLISGKLQIKEP